MNLSKVISRWQMCIFQKCDLGQRLLTVLQKFHKPSVSFWEDVDMQSQKSGCVLFPVPSSVRHSSLRNQEATDKISLGVQSSAGERLSDPELCF